MPFSLGEVLQGIVSSINKKAQEIPVVLNRTENATKFLNHAHPYKYDQNLLEDDSEARIKPVSKSVETDNRVFLDLEQREQNQRAMDAKIALRNPRLEE